MDASAIVRICAEFSNTKVFAITEQSVCDGLGIRCGTGVACNFQLVINTEAWMGLNWSSNHPQHFMVAHSYWTIVIHIHYQIGWGLEWILMACICRLVGFCQAFFSICCYVMVNFSSLIHRS